MDLSITTDYAKDKGCPEPYLRKIAEAGFTHVHWCHQWNTDFVYSDCEIEQIGKWLREFGLRLLDLHGSIGPEKSWCSSREYERLAGIELVRNRIAMTARLGGDVVIMHAPEPAAEAEKDIFRSRLFASMQALAPFAKERGVRIAIENGNFQIIRKILAEFSPEYVGLCYDSGHGNMIAGGLDHLESLKDRLISIHLHDNDGTGDQHKPLFTGTVDWPRLARIAAGSSYAKCVSLEVSMRLAGITDEDAFLAEVYRGGVAFARMMGSRPGRQET